MLDFNPLYRVWKTKSFTDNDIMLHFLLLDYLSAEEGHTIEEITDGLLEQYETFFEPQMIRRKCNAYVKEGLLCKKKSGKELFYYKNPDFQNILAENPELTDALKFYQFSSPLGILGDTILDNQNEQNNIFRVKHSFFVHTLEDQILLEIFQAIQQQCQIELLTKSTKNGFETKQQGIPLQIFVSTRTGRRFLCLYQERSRRFIALRMDSIKHVELLQKSDKYQELKEKLLKNHSLVWGVSFQSSKGLHNERIVLTLSIHEEKEDYIIERLKREGKGGIITHIAPNTYTFEKEVFDSNEMLPWIRTFTGRIIDIQCDSKWLQHRFYEDMEKMYDLYDI